MIKGKHFLPVLVMLLFSLSLVTPVSSARTSGVVSVCDEAHLLAALSGGGMVTFSCSGTIVLTSTILITDDTTIDGSEHVVIISGGGAVRVFYVNEDAEVNLNELSIIDGYNGGMGGGIYNSGTLMVTNSNISNNSADWGGGGINNTGTLTLTNNNISNNYTDWGGGLGGAGIYNWGTLTVSNTNFSGNEAATNGGAIYNQGTLTVSNSIFSSNGTYRRGGGIYNDGLGIVSVDNSTFSTNSGYEGGGISNEGALTVTNSSFSGNSASYGGGIYNSGTFSVSNSSFSGNSALFNGGGILNSNTNDNILSNNTYSNNSAEMFGGGTFNQGTLTVSNSTFSSNSASYGGGISNQGTLTVSNSTFSGNSANWSGGGISNQSIGGGPYWSYLTVNNSTFYSNNAHDGAGGISASISSDDFTHLSNTIVANNTGFNCEGIIIDKGGNLTYPDTTCPGTKSEPLLGPLQDNGGLTHTIALGAGSPAIDAGDPSSCAATDQRGVNRPIDGDGDGEAICDIGAFEYRPLTTETTITGDHPNPSRPGEAFTVAFEVTSQAGVPIGAVTVTVSGSTATCSADLVAGAGCCTLSLNKTGMYTLTVNYMGADSFFPSSATGLHTVSNWQLYLPALRK